MVRVRPYMVKIDIEIIKAVNAPVVILYISKRTMARQGGFPIIIFCNQAKSEYFQCLVCTEVCRSPVTCKSGHLFCHNCLSESLRRNSSCPACRERLTAPVPSAFAAAQVSALDVMCVHDKCKWIGTCGRLDGHLDTDCPHEPIKCSGEGGCGELVPRGEMATHQQFVCLQSCPNSKAKAKRHDGPGDEQDSCDVRLSRHDLVDHLKDYCKLRIIHCPHTSCEVTTRYNQMPAHREVCPYAPVAMPSAMRCRGPYTTKPWKAQNRVSQRARSMRPRPHWDAPMLPHGVRSLDMSRILRYIFHLSAPQSLLSSKKPTNRKLMKWNKCSSRSYKHLKRRSQSYK